MLRIKNPYTKHCRIANPAERKGNMNDKNWRSIHCRIANPAEHKRSLAVL